MNPTTDRREFLGQGALTAAVAAGGWLMASGQPAEAAQAQQKSEPSAEARLQELGLKLPPISPSTATFVPAVQTGDLLFVSGHVSRRADGSRIEGKLGEQLTTQQGNEAARQVALAVLATVRQTVGSLDKVARTVKVLGMVNASPTFTEHPQVINGFSDLLVEVFGEAGKGARSAVGMSSLPGNAAVEIEAIFELKPKIVQLPGSTR
jgi:enamine deaminase RidA (YjgF/YER057c/UK114 family)